MTFGQPWRCNRILTKQDKTVQSKIFIKLVLPSCVLFLILEVSSVSTRIYDEKAVLVRLIPELNFIPKKNKNY